MEAAPGSADPPEQGGLVRRALSSRVVGQSALFSLATALVLVIGAVGKAILANELTPEAFGNFAFATSFLLFTALFFEFGLFTPAARRIARAEDTRREVIGASLATFVPIGGLFCAATFALSFAVDPVFNVDAGSALRVVSPLAFVYAFSQAASQIAQGSDRVGVYSLAGLAGQVAFIAVLVVAVSVGDEITITQALFINTGGLVVTLALTAWWLRPAFGRVLDHARVFVADMRAWGFQLYIGRVLSIGTYQMDVLMVAAFTEPEDVGFYVLATAIAQATGLPIEGLGAAVFSRSARTARLDRRWLAAAWAVGAAGVVVIAFAAAPLVELVFSSEYAPVAGLAVPLAMAQAVRGVTTIYNTFLSANARGRELRNCGLVLTASNLALNFALIPPFGATGAAWASFAALVANYAAHVYYYRRTPTQPQVP